MLPRKPLRGEIRGQSAGRVPRSVAPNSVAASTRWQSGNRSLRSLTPEKTVNVVQARNASEWIETSKFHCWRVGLVLMLPWFADANRRLGLMPSDLAYYRNLSRYAFTVCET